MSCEHDWLAGGDLLRGLGVTEPRHAPPWICSKVRMSANSQHLYSMLDTLTLCISAGVRATCSLLHKRFGAVRDRLGLHLLELMKVGERKTNLMRLVNARRGFTSKEDILPDRLYEPVPDGPSKGLYRDRELFPKMLRDDMRCHGLGYQHVAIPPRANLWN